MSSEPWELPEGKEEGSSRFQILTGGRTSKVVRPGWQMEGLTTSPGPGSVLLGSQNTSCLCHWSRRLTSEKFTQILQLPVCMRTGGVPDGSHLPGPSCFLRRALAPGGHLPAGLTPHGPAVTWLCDAVCSQVKRCHHIKPATSKSNKPACIRGGSETLATLSSLVLQLACIVSL